MSDLKIQKFHYEVYVPQQAYYIVWQAVEYYAQPNQNQFIQIGGSQDLGASPFPQFTSLSNGIAYYDSAKCTALLGDVNGNIGTTVFTSYTLDSVSPPVAASLSIIQDAITALNASKVDKTTTVNTHALSSSITVDYNDLTNKPTIPSAQVQSDWTASSGLGVILHKPSTQSAITDATGGATNNLPTNYNLVSGLLGVANGLNDANTAQNDMANKLNALVTSYNGLLAKLRTYGVITT